MAKFNLNPGAVQQATPGYRPERVRIGSISLFALVVIICLAVLSVLSFSTANASLIMSQRQATAMSQLYQDERAAQEFLAGVDGILANIRDGEMAKAVNAQTANQILMSLAERDEETATSIARDEEGNYVFDEHGYLVVQEQDTLLPTRAGEVGSLAIEEALDDLCAAARAAADGTVDVSASVDENKIAAEFNCNNGRLLNVVITVRNNGTYRIDRWRMSAVQNEEQPEGQLLIIDD